MNVRVNSRESKRLGSKSLRKLENFKKISGKPRIDGKPPESQTPGDLLENPQKYAVEHPKETPIPLNYTNLPLSHKWLHIIF